MTTHQESHDLNGKTFQILSILYPDELQFLQSVSSLVDVPANTSVIIEGQDNHKLYLVKSGILHVSKRHHGVIFDIGAITPGEIFGEGSMLYHTTAGANVHSIEGCTLYVIDAAHLQEVIQNNSRFNHAIRQLSERRSAAGALAINPIFSHLPQNIREVILYNGEYISLKEGDVLFHEGEKNTEAVYLILSGRAEVSIQHPSNPSKKVVFATLTSGDEIGEAPLMTHKAHAATVTAVASLRLFKISTQSMQLWIQRYSDFERALHHGVQHKLQHNLKALRQKDFLDAS
ncbi:MAG: cyclic nucleotide-binding domain-containing protein [Mariprofundaceae bacterium]|nr:cyclic nucleotide-binding domain-containing protein [Mariprofundaceae bacterium]